MTHKVGDHLKANLNAGYSLGLQYPMIYGERDGQWVVWHRHTGEITYVWDGKYPALQEYETGDECYRQNGLNPRKVDPEVLAAIDDTP